MRARLWTRKFQRDEKHNNKNKQPNSHAAHLWVFRVPQRRPSCRLFQIRPKSPSVSALGGNQRARRTAPYCASFKADQLEINQVGTSLLQLAMKPRSHRKEIRRRKSHVRFGSLADIFSAKRHVRFSPNSD